MDNFSKAKYDFNYMLIKRSFLRRRGSIYTHKTKEFQLPLLASLHSDTFNA